MKNFYFFIFYFCYLNSFFFLEKFSFEKTGFFFEKSFENQILLKEYILLDLFNDEKALDLGININYEFFDCNFSFCNILKLKLHFLLETCFHLKNNFFIVFGFVYKKKLTFILGLKYNTKYVNIKFRLTKDILNKEIESTSESIHDPFFIQQPQCEHNLQPQLKPQLIFKSEFSQPQLKLSSNFDLDKEINEQILNFQENQYLFLMDYCQDFSTHLIKNIELYDTYIAKFMLTSYFLHSKSLLIKLNMDSKKSFSFQEVMKNFCINASYEPNNYAKLNYINKILYSKPDIKKKLEKVQCSKDGFFTCLNDIFAYINIHLGDVDFLKQLPSLLIDIKEKALLNNFDFNQIELLDKVLLIGGINNKNFSFKSLNYSLKKSKLCLAFQIKKFNDEQNKKRAIVLEAEDLKNYFINNNYNVNLKNNSLLFLLAYKLIYNKYNAIFEKNNYEQKLLEYFEIFINNKEESIKIFNSLYDKYKTKYIKDAVSKDEIRLLIATNEKFNAIYEYKNYKKNFINDVDNCHQIILDLIKLYKKEYVEDFQKDIEDFLFEFLKLKDDNCDIIEKQQYEYLFSNENALINNLKIFVLNFKGLLLCNHNNYCFNTTYNSFNFIIYPKNKNKYNQFSIDDYYNNLIESIKKNVQNILKLLTEKIKKNKNFCLYLNRTNISKSNETTIVTFFSRYETNIKESLNNINYLNDSLEGYHLINLNYIYKKFCMMFLDQFASVAFKLKDYLTVNTTNSMPEQLKNYIELKEIDQELYSSYLYAYNFMSSEYIFDPKILTQQDYLNPYHCYTTDNFKNLNKTRIVNFKKFYSCILKDAALNKFVNPNNKSEIYENFWNNHAYYYNNHSYKKIRNELFNENMVSEFSKSNNVFLPNEEELHNINKFDDKNYNFIFDELNSYFVALNNIADNFMNKAILNNFIKDINENRQNIFDILYDSFNDNNIKHEDINQIRNNLIDINDIISRFKNNNKFENYPQNTIKFFKKTAKKFDTYKNMMDKLFLKQINSDEIDISWFNLKFLCMTYIPLGFEDDYVFEYCFLYKHQEKYFQQDEQFGVYNYNWCKDFRHPIYISIDNNV